MRSEERRLEERRSDNSGESATKRTHPASSGNPPPTQHAITVSQMASEEIFAVADVNHDGEISFPEFYRAFCLLTLAIGTKNEAAARELFFETIDADSDGAISRSELLVFADRLIKVGGVPTEDVVVDGWVGLRPRTANGGFLYSRCVRARANVYSTRSGEHREGEV